MGYFRNPFSDALDAHRGCSGSVPTPSTARDECEIEMCQWSPNVTDSEATGHNKRMTDSWKEDASAKVVLKFVSSFHLTTCRRLYSFGRKLGFFAPIVVSFIIGGYKMLPSGSGDGTSPPTCQVSEEIASDTCVQLQACSPPRPSTLIVWAYIMWLMSLVLVIASALFATLKQRWASKFIGLPQFAMTVALIYLSVFLFLGGLVLFFFTISKTVAIVISVTVGLFVIVLLTLTVLACLCHNYACDALLSDVCGERRDYW